MTNDFIFSHVDHTLLKATAAWRDIRALCEEAERYHMASVCVPSSFVKKIREHFPSLTICTVVGFPLGNCSRAAKTVEAAEAIRDGADEIDMVIHIGALKEGNLSYVTGEIKAVKESIGDHILKVIVETCYLTEEEKTGRSSHEERGLKFRWLFFRFFCTNSQDCAGKPRFILL